MSANRPSMDSFKAFCFQDAFDMIPWSSGGEVRVTLAQTLAHTEPSRFKTTPGSWVRKQGKILLFWIKALKSKYQEDENLINDLCKPKLSKPDSHIYPLLPFCCENASPKVKVSWSRGKVKSGSTLSISKRIPLDTLTTKVVPKKSMVVYQLRWSDWRDSGGKAFMLAC